MNILLAALISLTLLLPVTVATAAPTACPEQYYDRQAPDLVNQKLAAKTKEICYSEYGVLHSGVTRTPLYAGEHLTSEQIQQAKVMVRKSKFFPEPRLPRAERAELRYYTGSGYDRGHLAPSGDMPTEASQQECFSLANIVPQDPKNNRGVWEGIETAVRNLARDRGDIYVVTGTVYSGDNVKRIGGAVMVPTSLFKAVYDPQRQQAGAYLVDNAAGAQPQMISLAELAQVTGIDAFPAVSTEVKAAAMPLPSPKSYKERKRRGGH